MGVWSGGMLKSRPADNEKHQTKTRACFLRDRIDSRCSAKMFRKYVGELNRLEGILRSGSTERPQGPDVYDRMLAAMRHSGPGAKPEVDPTRQPSAPEEDSVFDMHDVDEATASLRRTEGFIGKKVEGRYHNHNHSSLHHTAVGLTTGLEQRLKTAIKDPSKDNDEQLERYMQ